MSTRRKSTHSARFSRLFRCRKSAPLRCKAVRRAVWRTAPICLRCRAVRGPARMHGTRYWSSNWTTVTSPAILWKSCRVWMNIYAANSAYGAVQPWISTARDLPRTVMRIPARSTAKLVPSTWIRSDVAVIRVAVRVTSGSETQT